MFFDRVDAGNQLAKKLAFYKKERVILLALPRGGVMVGFPIAKAFHLPLSALIVRKIGSPHNPEYGIGAVSEDGIVIRDEDAIEHLDISEKEFRKLQRAQEEEVERRRVVYRNDEDLPSLRDKVVIIIDDGLATGVTAQAAVAFVKKRKPKTCVFAVPIASLETAEKISREVDKLIVLQAVQELSSIGSYYEDFSEVTDEQVVQMLSYLNELVTDN